MIKVNEGIRLVILISIFFLQFLGYVIYVNSLGSLSKDINFIQGEKTFTSQQIRDYYNKEVKDLKKEVDFFGEDQGLLRLNSSDYVNYRDIKLDESDLEGSAEGVLNSNRSFSP